MHTRVYIRIYIVLLVSSVCGLISGCSVILKDSSPSRTYYVLGDKLVNLCDTATSPLSPWKIFVQEPKASLFLNSSRIVFSRTTGTRGAYQLASWVDPLPSRMGGLIINKLECEGYFKVVGGAGFKSDFLLDTHIEEFYHDVELEPGKVVVIINVELIDLKEQSPIAKKKFSYTHETKSFDVDGAVDAFDNVVSIWSTEMVGWLKNMNLAQPTQIPQKSPLEPS